MDDSWISGSQKKSLTPVHIIQPQKPVFFLGIKPFLWHHRTGMFNFDIRGIGL